MEKFHWIIPSILVCTPLGARGEDSVQLQSSESHSRIVIRVDQGVPVKWMNQKLGFEIFFKGVNLNELGAPVGDEEDWQKQVAQLGDPRVGSISVQESAGGVKISGKWKFPTGKSTLADPEMIAFDYWQKAPSRYVVDFWLKKSQTLSALKESLLRNKPREALAQYKKKMSLKSVRKPESVKKSIDFNSFSYCKEALTEENDVFLDFNPVHQKVDFSRWFPTTTADQNYHYYKPEKSESKGENEGKGNGEQYLRLALNLANQGKSALAIRALEFMDEEFPQSKYRDETRFLKANSLIKLGYESEGEKILKDLSTGTATAKKDEEIALQTSLFLAMKMWERDSVLSALEQFMRLIHRYPQSPLIWVFHLGAAECLYSLKQTERALKEYQWVMENASKPSEKAEAVFRMGDLFLLRRQYDQAIVSYSHAFKYFPTESKRYPSYYLNRGESFYQLGHFKESKEVFESFLADFPNHSQGWRASFRLGELAARTMKKESDIAQARQWFYNTINRYPSSPGVILSRIRLVPCGDHAGMTFETQDRFFFTEAEQYDGKGEVLLDRYADFRILSHARTVVALGSTKQSLEGAVRDISLVKNPKMKKVLISTAHQLLGKVVRELLNQGKKYEALSYYSRIHTQIPALSSIFSSQGDFNTHEDVEYLFSLSQAASDLGLAKFALKLLKTHQSLTAKKAPSVEASHLDDSDFQLKDSEKAYAEAKALWIEGRESGAKLDSAKIRQLLEKVTDESRYSYQKCIILALLEEKEGNSSLAKAHLARAQLMTHTLRIDGWLAALQEKEGDLKSSLETYRTMEKALLSEKKKSESKIENEDDEDFLGVPLLLSLEQIVLAEGALLEKLGRWSEAASTYFRAIDNGLKGDQIQYEYARALLRSKIHKDITKAKKTLEKLATSQPKIENDLFWKKLAGEALANILEKEKRRKVF